MMGRLRHHISEAACSYLLVPQDYGCDFRCSKGVGIDDFCSMTDGSRQQIPASTAFAVGAGRTNMTNKEDSPSRVAMELGTWKERRLERGEEVDGTRRAEASKSGVRGALEGSREGRTVTAGGAGESEGRSGRRRGWPGSGAHLLQSLTGYCGDSDCSSQKNGESLQACQQKILSFCVLDAHKRMVCKSNYSLVSPQYVVPGRCSGNICRMDE